MVVFGWWLSDSASEASALLKEFSEAYSMGFQSAKSCSSFCLSFTMRYSVTCLTVCRVHERYILFIQAIHKERAA